ncbi:MAG TPA: D-alanyl-D-alanine carboxypeptidase/D-alanyl-D-alanine-endopeptidase [Gemmatimonadales bacterium]|nr:D-alanyl-D-alanine carboxypeptidase/D-alanyl-D-alanine-endopeptidase [Gemmatimonadales bacterium]
MAVLLAGCAARGAVPRLAPEVASLAASLDSTLADPAFGRSSWGVVVESADSGQVLYRRDAERLFVPASNLKLLTAAAALVRLGADFRWTTTVLAGGARRGDTLAGDLLVVGRGDPTFAVDATGDSTDMLRSLRSWVDSLTMHGVHVIRGRVVGDASAFTDPPLGRGWAWDDLDADYAAPVGALQFNESVAWIEVTPGVFPGAAASVLLEPFEAPLRVFGTVTTAPRDSAAQVTWSRAPFGDSVTVGGGVPLGHATARLPVSVPDPTHYFEAALTQALREGGMAMLGTPLPDPPAAETLFTWRSPPLSVVLPLLLKPSQNQIGETLLRTLGLQVKGVGSVDSGRAVIGDVLAAFGVAPDAWVLADGSGLSRYDDVAPEAIAAVLEAMYRRPDFPVFLDALPVAGVDGTLATRLQGTAAAGNAHAKTGSMAGVRTLAGYVRTPGGETLVFVLLANNVTAPRRVVEAAQDRIVERLANFERRSR